MHQHMKVWTQVFQELIQEVKPGHIWTLNLDENLIPNTLQPGWTQYQQWVFARFQCSLCFRNWASSQVHVLFQMHWSKRESKGQVKMRIFAQRCRKCCQPPFEIPEFTEENISRILQNLVFRILKKCYKERFELMKEISTVKDIYLEGPHDVDNCEACLQGFCAQSGLGLTTQPPKSLALPRISLPTSEIPIIKPSATESSTTVTRNAMVEQRKAPPNPWFPEPTQAASLRANTNHRVETIRTSEIPIIKPSATESSTTVTRNARVEKRKVSPNPWFPEPTRAASLRANTNHRVETRIQIPHSSDNVYSCVAQNPKYGKSGFCCCLIILILIIVVVVIVVKIYV